MIDIPSLIAGAGIGGSYHIFKGAVTVIKKVKEITTQAQIAKLEKFNTDVANTLNALLSSPEIQALVTKTAPTTEQTETKQLGE